MPRSTSTRPRLRLSNGSLKLAVRGRKSSGGGDPMRSRVILPVSSPDFIGEYTMTLMCCSAKRQHFLLDVTGHDVVVGLEGEVMGAILPTRFICSTLKFDTPMYRTLPSLWSWARVCQPSSISGSGSGQWI